MIWGYLENVDELSSRSPHIQVRTLLPGGGVIRIRAYIGPQTLIAMFDVSGLWEDECVQLSYEQDEK
jgi:hypothetical protein